MGKDHEEGHYLRLLARSSFIVFVALFISKLLNYTYKIVIARSFGAEVYGLFSLAFILVSLLVALSSLGLNEGIVRYVSFFRGKNQLEKAKFIIKRSLSLVAISSLVISILLVIFAKPLAVEIFNKPDLTYYLIVMGLSIPFGVLSAALLAVIRSFEDIKVYSLLTYSFFSVAKLALLFMLIGFGWKFASVPWSYSLALVALTGAAYFFSRKYRLLVSAKRKISKTVGKKIFRELRSYSWPLIFFGILISVFIWTDSLVIGYLRSAEDVGFYNVAITLVTLFSIAPDLFLQLFLPLISKKLSQNKRSLIKSMSKQVSKWIYLINLPIFIVLFAFPGVVINFFFGSEFLFAQEALRILAIGGILGGFGAFLNGLLSMKGYSKLILKNLIVVALINLIIDVILVKEYGIVGAAIATSISWLILILITSIQVKMKYDFFAFKRTMIKITLVMVLPLVFLMLIGEYMAPTIFNLILIGAIFVVSYLGLLFFTKCIDKQDWEIIHAVKDKFLSIPLPKIG